MKENSNIKKSKIRILTIEELYMIHGGKQTSKDENEGDYTVKKGDTLSKIVREHYPDATSKELSEKIKETAKNSGIENPDLIHPGQKIVFENAKPETPSQKSDKKKRPKEQTQNKDKEASDNYDRQEDTIYEDEKSIKYGHDEKKENKNVSTKTIGTVDNQSHNKKNKIDGKQNFAKSNIHEKTGGIFENMLLKIFNPPEYERRLMIRRAAANDIHSRQHNMLSETLENIPQTIWYGATEWHYEMRDKLNKYDTSIYTHKIILDEQMEWRRETRDIFHQDGIEPKERKYCHPNGWEVVYDGKSLVDQNPRVVTDDKIRGTYNYIDPGAPPENWYDVPRWTEYAARGIGHTVVDIVPYWILGNSRK